MSRPKALITGITGQDGSYLALSLLQDGYEVFGTSGSSISSKKWRFQALGISDHPNLKLVDWDITNPDQTNAVIAELKPDELYNLASHSFVADSLFNPQKTTLVSGLAPINIMESIGASSPDTRFFQAGSSEMFGTAATSPQSENSSFSPRNIYGSAKVFAHSATVNYRENRQLFSASGILYNHESPLRGDEFVTKKITSTVAKVKLNQVDQLRIGNLSSLRDWGYAPEYVEAMRLILGYSVPETFVISSGVATTVRDFVRSAFNALDMEIEFEGSGLSEVGYEPSTGRKLVSVEKEFYRESESVTLVGDSSKASRLLGWKAKTPVAEIVSIMVRQDLDSLGSRFK
jgi:GDPmannose 4,6-dehydratase